MGYITKPGIYAIGAPDASSPVFVSANYQLSFNLLRRALAGTSGWILVLDTKGINVWCAAGKGTFGTEELIKRIIAVRLDTIVSHRRLIVPQLGAAGIRGHFVTKSTGFSINWGPVDLRDLPAYLAADCRATPAMRTVRFSFTDRLILTPMELIPALKKLALGALILLAVCGLRLQGILFKEALSGAGQFIVMGISAVLCGSLLAPLLLPIIPFRSFAIKGWLIGCIGVPALQFLVFDGFHAPLATVINLLFFPALSSYLALNFTGCTPFTSISGVKKELKYALPAYMTVSVVAVALFLIHQYQQWRLP
jgi:hypothetical protein